jgi:hypothetical protein
MISNLDELKLWMFTVIIWLLLGLTWSAQAQFLTFRPPPEFDKPFDGTVITERVGEANMKEICPDGTMGCSITPPQKAGKRRVCLIILASDDFYAKRGIEMREMVRHEVGHCNGWPADHGGITTWQKVQQ